MIFKNPHLYDGARTPGYPLFLAFIDFVLTGNCQLEYEPYLIFIIGFLQYILYAASSFYLVKFLTVNNFTLIKITYLLYLLSPIPLKYTHFILTEGLLFSMVNLILLLFIKITLKKQMNCDYWLLLLLALTVLIKPNFLVISIPFLFYIYFY